MSCGKQGCNYKSKQYGVCGVHKRWAFQDHSSNFQNELGDLEFLYNQYHTLARELQDQGYDILQIQAYWNNNLTRTPVNALPPHFYNLGLLINQIKDKICDMQTRYNNYLVYNNQIRINHKLSNCTCQYCNLGKTVQVN